MKKWINKQTILAFILGAFLFSGSVGAAVYYQFTLSTDSLYVAGTKINSPMYKLNGSNYAPLSVVGKALGNEVQYKPGRVDITPPRTDLETVAKNVESCVLIRVYSTTDPATAQLVGTGSGVVIKDGIIATNKHVLDAGKMYGVQYWDTAAGMEFKTTDIILVDTNLDIGFIRTLMPSKAVKLGDSDKLLIGQKILAISSPGGLKNQVSEGIISGFSSDKDGQTIQTNAYLSKGSSGGGIFNMNSELIGVYSSTLTEDKQYSFVIPINVIKPLLENLK